MKDDGIKFQWGDEYIRSEQIIPGVGGKYWKYDKQGRVISYTLPHHVFKSFVSWLINDPSGTPISSLKDMKVDYKKYSIKFKDVNHLNFAIREASSGKWVSEFKPNLSIKSIDEHKLVMVLDVEDKVYSGSESFID